jgi:hypothetical protein
MLGQLIEMFKHGAGVVAFAAFCADTDGDVVEDEKAILSPKIDRDFSFPDLAATNFTGIVFHLRHPIDGYYTQCAGLGNPTDEMHQSAIVSPASDDMFATSAVELRSHDFP